MVIREGIADLTSFRKMYIYNFFRVGTVTPGAAINCSVIDTTNQFAYFGRSTTPGTITKIDLSTFTIVSTISISGTGNFKSAVIDIPNQFAYFGTNDSPGIVTRLSLSTFTTSSITLNSGENNLASAVIESGFAYFGTSDTPGKVTKINLSTFTEVSGPLILNSGELILRSAVIDPVNRFAYFGCQTSNGLVAKVNLSTFTEVSGPVETIGASTLGSAVIDVPNQLAYFGSGDSPGTITKINLSTFTRVGSILLHFADGSNPTEASLFSAIIDTRDNFAIFGCNTNPGRIVKIKLSTFTRVGGITLPSIDATILSAVIDVQNGFAYFSGTQRIIKVAVI